MYYVCAAPYWPHGRTSYFPEPHYNRGIQVKKALEDRAKAIKIKLAMLTERKELPKDGESEKRRVKRYAKPFLAAMKAGAAGGVGTAIVLKYNELKQLLSDVVNLSFIYGEPSPPPPRSSSTIAPKTERKIPKFVELLNEG